MPLTPHPYKRSNFWWKQWYFWYSTSVVTSENITVTIWWTNKGTIKYKGCDQQKSGSRDGVFKRKIRNLERKLLSKSTKTSLSITAEETILKYLIFLVIELEKIEIVPNNQLFVLLIESLPNKNFITGKNWNQQINQH